MEERFAFVLRIWVQRGDSAHKPEQLRGTLESAGPEPPRYFSSLTQLTQMLAATMETPESLTSPSRSGTRTDASSDS